MLCRIGGIVDDAAKDVQLQSLGSELNTALARVAAEQARVAEEQARRDADRQQRYLAVHLHPQAAEISEYPKRLRNGLLAAFVLFASWGIGALIVYSVRDHLT